MAYTVSSIVDLRIYPIKSCRGISVPSAQITHQGLFLDRRWMFVDSTHTFITIRQHSQMTLIKTALNDAQTELTITVPEHADGSGTPTSITVPVQADESWLARNAKLVPVEIWGAGTDAYEYTDPSYASIFQKFFGAETYLVVKGPTKRVCRGNAAPELLGREEHVNFPDVLPVQIASLSSLAELNRRLEERGADAITVERFRPNIIIEGGEPWSEDDWKTVRLNGDNSWITSLKGGNREAVDLDVVARCARCQVPNVDPDTAVKDKHEPWDLLVSYRRVDEGIKYKPCFGMLCCPRGEGRVELGMRFEVTEETKMHYYIKGF